ncbi:hypothetical protein AB0F72_16835 [Actinoplanes sp. NPDC023936]|uniref:hypothetical protein n=1 Tax=Actinoplanes sp. NPDC023936 TaxID=3154910 RepID=UPI0033DBC3FE
MRNLSRSSHALPNFEFFLIRVVCPAVGIYLILYVTNGFTNGWGYAYDLSSAIVSPRDPRVQYVWLAWPLAVTGHFFMPALIGAVAGYAFGARVNRRRSSSRRAAGPPIGGTGEAVARTSTDEASDLGHQQDPVAPTPVPLMAAADSLAGPSRWLSKIPELSDRRKTAEFGITNAFVDYFVAVHDGDWKIAQDHFELEVVDNLEHRDVVSPEDPPVIAMRLGVVDSVDLLWRARTSSTTGKCPICHTDLPDGERRMT